MLNDNLCNPEKWTMLNYAQWSMQIEGTNVGMRQYIAKCSRPRGNL